MILLKHLTVCFRHTFRDHYNTVFLIMYTFAFSRAHSASVRGGRGGRGGRRCCDLSSNLRCLNIKLSITIVTFVYCDVAKFCTVAFNIHHAVSGEGLSFLAT